MKEATIKEINAQFRANDESHKWPVCGRFNVTERAITRARKIRSISKDNSGYAELLNSLISDIVNKEV